MRNEEVDCTCDDYRYGCFNSFRHEISRGDDMSCHEVKVAFNLTAEGEVCYNISFLIMDECRFNDALCFTGREKSVAPVECN